MINELDFSKLDLILENTKLKLDVLASEFRYPIVIKKEIKRRCPSCDLHYALMQGGAAMSSLGFGNGNCLAAMAQSPGLQTRMQIGQARMGMTGQFF